MLKIKQPGFYTTLQDLGRYHYRQYGVPVSGAMDQGALRRANALLENEPGAAALEITMRGPEVEFGAPTFMVLSGARLEASLNGDRLEMDRVYQVPAGSRLLCGQVLRGLRSYLAVKGGVLTEVRLGSRSYFPPVTRYKSLARNMELPYAPCTGFSPRLLKLNVADSYGQKEVRVWPGPEFDLLNASQRTRLFETEYRLAKEHDRMACQLAPVMEGIQTSMITSATLPGTVQLTPAGKLLVLLRDGQTTGGYPRVLQLDPDSIDLMGQKKAGDAVRFQWA
jgi:biotin-dependent carboxylase-like uncharacterized protein